EAVPFDREVFQQDLRFIEELYEAQGYPDATIVRVDEQFDARAREIALHIVIDEGEPIRLAAIEYVGFEVLRDEAQAALREQAPLEPGDPLAREQVDATTRAALRALGNAGYAYAGLNVEEIPVA